MLCPQCNKVLIPYVYAEADTTLSQLQDKKMLIIGGPEYQVGYPTFFCNYCLSQEYFTSAEVLKISSKRSYAKKQLRGES
jgi:hypothetical protein